MTVEMSRVNTPSLDITKSTRLKKETGTLKQETKRLNLKIVEHPLNTFYKDEGGKSNHLTAKAVLVVRGSESARVNVGSISVTPKLVYEDGREVEDADEIFTLLEVEPRYLKSTNEPIVLKYRVEKVSRRKDGKKFQVRFEVDAKNSKVAGDFSLRGIESAVTSAVVVLSKRKLSFSGKSQSNGAKQVSKRRNVQKRGDKMLECSVKDWENMKSSMARMKETIARLTERLNRLENDRKSKLEADFGKGDLLMRANSTESVYSKLTSPIKCRQSSLNQSYIPMEIFSDELEEVQKPNFEFDDGEGLFVQF